MIKTSEEKRERYKIQKLLRNVRRKRGWTQKQAAEIAGVVETTIRRWEAGDVIPSEENYNRFMQAAGETPPKNLNITLRKKHTTKEYPELNQPTGTFTRYGSPLDDIIIRLTEIDELKAKLAKLEKELDNKLDQLKEQYHG